MKSNRDTILDEITDDIRNEQVHSSVVDQAANRVWARIAAAAEGETGTVAAERIEGCKDFQSLIPAYLKGSLSEARSLLLIDHTHECIPCRKAMKETRQQETLPVRRATATRRYSLQPAILRWGIAAAVVIGFGLLALPLIQRYVPFERLDATVQAAEGQVYQIADTRSVAIKGGDKVNQDERIRTAKDAHAFIRLADGSMIEMRDRSEISFTQSTQGTTVHLDRGAIFVEAAKLPQKHLFVDTGDSLVSVTGTVFTVNNGTKGSRVSVIEGEVHLDHGGTERVLRSGEQATTNRAIEMVPIKEEVAWSRKAAQYGPTLAGLSALKSELNKVAQPGVRNSTHLLDLMPENTVVYAALPNLAVTLAESHRIMQERISENAALREWWEKERSGHHGPNMDQVVNTVREFGDYLGDEIAVSVSMNEKGQPVAPMVLADLKNAAGLRPFIEQQVAKYAGDNQRRTVIQFVENPATAQVIQPDAGKKNELLYVWIQNDLFAASPQLQQLQDLSNRLQTGTGSFTATAFHNRIAQIYKEGAGLVVAANLERVIEQTRAEREKGAGADQREEALKKLGVLSVKYFVLDQKDGEGKTHTRAALSFNDAQRGIPSWLAAPGPMGSLQYISPDANVVAGFVVKSPAALVSDLLGVIGTVSPSLGSNLEKLQTDHGLDIRQDLASPLGGEFAFAIDGPILPTPSWKMVFEVNDSEHLQKTLEQIVGEINKEAVKFGKGSLIWDRGEISGRTYYTLRSTDFGVEVNYAYVNGYMVVGPSKALVERSIRSQESGYSLLHSARFTAGLPADGNTNFSAVFYHNLAPLVQPIAERLANSSGNLAQEQQQAIKTMAQNMSPTLAYAYAENDGITFGANTEGGPFGLSPATLLGMPNALEIQTILQHGMGERGSRK